MTLIRRGENGGIREIVRGGGRGRVEFIVLWDTPHRRAAGFAVEVLRRPRTHEVLTALADGMHMRPSEILGVLVRAGRRDAPVVGARPLDYRIVVRKVAELHGAGLVARCGEHAARGSHTAYDLTRLGAGLAGSLDGLGDWGAAHFGQLVRASRLRRELDPGAPVPPARRPPDRHTARLAVRLALGALDTRWAFSALVHCSAGPVAPGELLARVNGAIAGQPDLAGRRHLATGPLYGTLASLTRAGLLDRDGPDGPEYAARVLYRPSELGSGLLGALWPVAEWGVGHDREL